MINLELFERSAQLAELKVSYKRENAPESQQVRDSQTAADYLRSIWNPDTLELLEDFYVLYLNGAHKPLGWVRVASGGMNSALIDARVVFGIALQTAATAIIVAHNHPSGEPQPSFEDRAATANLKKAGDLLGITERCAKKVRFF